MISSNIKNGVNIFGISGSYTGSGLRVNRAILTARLGSFETKFSTSITTFQGLFIVLAEQGSSSSYSPITSLYVPVSFTLTSGQQNVFSQAYLSFYGSPYWVSATNYACYPNARSDGTWYFNMNAYDNYMFTGTYFFIYFYS